MRHCPLALTSLLLISHRTNRRSLLFCITAVFCMWMPNFTTGYHKVVTAHFTGRWCLSEDDRRHHKHLLDWTRKKRSCCTKESMVGRAPGTLLSPSRCKTFPHNYNPVLLNLALNVFYLKPTLV